ncbi:hypothetical protein NXF25_004351, partial [Crotalus adamanteus]
IVTKKLSASQLLTDSRNSAQGSKCQKAWSVGKLWIPCQTQAALQKTHECRKSFARRSLLLTHRKVHMESGSSQGLEAGKQLRPMIYLQNSHQHIIENRHKAAAARKHGAWETLGSPVRHKQHFGKPNQKNTRMLRAWEIFCLPVPPFDSQEGPCGKWIQSSFGG